MNKRKTLRQPDLKLSIGLFLIIIMFNNGQTLAQLSSENDTVKCITDREIKNENTKFLKITSMGFGGVALKFSRFNDQFAVMSGGRGSITINRRYTIGGGGYGIVNRISLESKSFDSYRFFKMGYGGLELGYIFFPGQKLNIGSAILIAGGAAFTESRPKTKDVDFRLFPVLEPSFYAEIGLSSMIRLQTGLTYRYISGAKLDFITDKDIRGFSVYMNLLFGSFGCK
jgi:hypothetical protein